MAEIVPYRKYPFKADEQDPILGDVNEALEKEGLSKKISVVKELSGVSAATLYNWRSGKTRFPRFATVAAVLGAIGMTVAVRRIERFDLEAERTDARRWNLRKLAAKSMKKSRRNGKENRASL